MYAFSNEKALVWFSLAHKHKHKDIRTRRMAYLTQFSIPALLNPMVNKMADEASAILLLICSHEVWVKVTYDWSTALCLCLCLCRPRFHWSKLPHKHKHKQKKNELVRFSCAYAYVDPVFTCLHMCLRLYLCLCVNGNQALVWMRIGRCVFVTTKTNTFENALVWTGPWSGESKTH